MAKLHFYYSAMNAGKSTTLLQSSYNYKERGMDTVLYAPAIDNRAGVGMVSTRIGLQEQACIFTLDTNIFDDFNDMLMKNSNLSCLLVDEAQFLTKAQVRQLARVADELNRPVLAYGLRTDFRGEPFPGSMYLLAWADLLIELKTICHCGRKATMNLRIDERGEPVLEGAQIVIGGNERYVSTCRKHFYLRHSKRQPKK